MMRLVPKIGSSWWLRGAVIGAFVALAMAARASAPTTREGVGTAEQVARGKAVYDKSCVTCHPVEFYSGRLPLWQNKPVSTVFESISASMPQDNPGSLLTSEYLDVLTYIFSITGSPAGKAELTTDTMESINVAPVQ